MNRSFYLDLAATGRRLPVATHLVLHQHSDPEAILLDGTRLAQVMAETARRFDSPLALPVMDLTLEKDILLRTLGLGGDTPAAFHFDAPPGAGALARAGSMDVLASPRIRANCDALARLARAHRSGATEVPIGMSIGPFSLLTKLLSDPILPIYSAGMGAGPEDDPDVALLEDLRSLCEATVHACVKAQIAAGAAAIFVCEPAANLVYFSPNQLAEGSSVFDDYVIQPNLRLKGLLDASGVDLIFHDCGSLTPGMIASFAVLDPAMISFGSPVNLWDAEPLVPKTTVLYGNLPTKKFYSDEEVPLHRVGELVCEIETRLKASGHPYIIGSECDVLSMPGYETTILEKVMALTSCSCG